MKIGTFLEQPFDYLNDNKTKWIYILGSASFAIVFLLLFQPYGISEEMKNPSNPLIHKGLFFISIAITTILALSISQFSLRQLFGFKEVINKRYLIWLLAEALLLLLINFGFSFIVPDLGDDFEQELNIVFQLKMYPRVLMVLVFPFLGTIIYVSIKRLNNEIQDLGFQLKTYKNKYEISKQYDTLTILDENENVDLKIKINNFLYAESSNQYILVHYLKHGETKKHIIRNRLKNFLGQSKDFPIKQCHRSYAVNLINVDYLTKKNGKEFLVIKAPNTILNIPVSNSYFEDIKKEFS